MFPGVTFMVVLSDICVCVSSESTLLMLRLIVMSYIFHTLICLGSSRCFSVWLLKAPRVPAHVRADVWLTPPPVFLSLHRSTPGANSQTFCGVKIRAVCVFLERRQSGWLLDNCLSDRADGRSPPPPLLLLPICCENERVKHQSVDDYQPQVQTDAEDRWPFPADNLLNKKTFNSGHWTQTNRNKRWS